MSRSLCMKIVYKAALDSSPTKALYIDLLVGSQSASLVVLVLRWFDPVLWAVCRRFRRPGVLVSRWFDPTLWVVCRRFRRPWALVLRWFDPVLWAVCRRFRRP